MEVVDRQREPRLSGVADCNAGSIGWNVVDRPVVPSTCRFVGVVAKQYQAARAGRHIDPGEWRRNVFAVTSKPAWDVSTVRKSAGVQSHCNNIGLTPLSDCKRCEL